MTKLEFLPFLMRRPNSILIIEDAENIIHDRRVDQMLPKQAVSHMLNLSDGLLGDVMHQQIICMFNCDVQNINPALLRDGRLIMQHKFDKLNTENARHLCVEVGVLGNGEDIQEATSLAEIYAQKNAAIKDLANGLENGFQTARSKRLLKKRSEKLRAFLGLYS